MRPPRHRALAALAALLLVALPAPRAAAEFDWPISLALPDNDWSLGVSGGVAFGEDYRARTTGWLAGVDVSWLEGLFGLHGGFRVSREGYHQRVGGYVEATVWYLVMIGVGTNFGGMAGDGGPGIEDSAVALHGYFGIPIPLWSQGDDAGALVLVPYARPGMRFLEKGGTQGYHEAGISLRWTSFGF